MPATDPATMAIDDLRARRLRVRRAAEVARMRRDAPGDATTPAVLADLEAESRLLTDELIARYAADLSLVDSLLDPAYPAHDTGEGRR